MSTTTSEDGAVIAQPTTNEAVSDDGALAIVTDDNGTPTMVPLSEANAEAPEAASQESATEETAAEEPAQAAESGEDDIKQWAEKKGLPLDDPVKLAKMYRDAEKKMHQATQEAERVKVDPPEEIPLTDDESMNQVIQRQNAAEIKLYVRDWFEANPDMKAHKSDLMQIAKERPWLSDMDDVRAHLLASPDFISKTRQEGGKQALENLAQKQSAVPPRAGASNPQAFSSDNVITPNNVYDLIEKNDQEWFEKNYNSIIRAQQGKS